MREHTRRRGLVSTARRASALAHREGGACVDFPRPQMRTHTQALTRTMRTRAHAGRTTISIVADGRVSRVPWESRGHVAVIVADGAAPGNPNSVAHRVLQLPALPRRNVRQMLQ